MTTKLTRGAYPSALSAQQTAYDQVRLGLDIQVKKNPVSQYLWQADQLFSTLSPNAGWRDRLQLFLMTAYNSYSPTPGTFNGVQTLAFDGGAGTEGLLKAAGILTADADFTIAWVGQGAAGNSGSFIWGTGDANPTGVQHNGTNSCLNAYFNGVLVASTPNGSVGFSGMHIGLLSYKYGAGGTSIVRLRAIRGAATGLNASSAAVIANTDFYVGGLGNLNGDNINGQVGAIYMANAALLEAPYASFLATLENALGHPYGL